MKIGFMLQSGTVLAGPGNGVRMQGLFQGEALRRLGHEVVLLSPWDIRKIIDFDIIQFFVGGLEFAGIEQSEQSWVRMLVFAPIIDSNEPFWKYRLAVRLGSLWPGRLFTVQGEFRKQARGSGLVVCRSVHEKERLIYGVGADPAKCEIVLNGVDPPPATDPDGARRKFNLPAEFALHVSAYTQGRKNVARLIQAVGPTGLPLVIAGTAVPGTELARLKALCQRYKNVQLLNWQERQTLYDLYAACKVFCLPSGHEGTGLVALEAAACGAQVVITKNGGPPDYFKNLAAYVDPFNVADIRQAFLCAWNKPRSDELRRHVLENLTWDQSAQRLLAAYQKHMSVARS